MRVRWVKGMTVKHVAPCPIGAGPHDESWHQTVFAACRDAQMRYTASNAIYMLLNGAGQCFALQCDPRSNEGSRCLQHLCTEAGNLSGHRML